MIIIISLFFPPIRLLIGSIITFIKTVYTGTVRGNHYDIRVTRIFPGVFNRVRKIGPADIPPLYLFFYHTKITVHLYSWIDRMKI